MSFYNERGEKVIPIFQDGVLISDDPEYINFTGNVEVTEDGMGGVIVDILGGSGGSSIAFETPTPDPDGENQVFTVAHTPIYIVVNGATLFEGAPDGYTFATGEITISFAPVEDSTIQSAYLSS